MAVVAAAATSAVMAAPAMAAFPGLNGKIAFARDDQIVTKTLGGVTDPPLTAAALGHGLNRDPAWSPDGRRIAFVSDRADPGTFDVWTMNADGSTPARVTFELGSAANPAWSPDGARIAYDVGDDTERDVVVMNADGSGRLVVGGGPLAQDLPVWTPDGSRIVFNDDGAGGLSSVTPGGAGRAPFLSDASAADYSPDGTRLAVVRSDGRIHVLNADGSGGSPLSPGLGGRPAWSPDGTRIAYFRFAGAPFANDLFTIGAAAGSAELQETNTTAVDVAPDWQPIPVPRAAPTGPPAPGPPGSGAPGLSLSSARFTARWKVSRPGGTLRISGSIVRAARLEAQVLPPNGRGRPLLTRGLRASAAGTFTIRIPLAGSRLLPGAYLVRLRELGSGPKLADASVRARLAAPPEGVVERAFISAAPGGRARTTIAGGPSAIFAGFAFAALPQRGRRLTVTWRSSAEAGSLSVAARPRAKRITASLREGGELPAGRYRAELRAGGTLVAVARARVR
jgi:TolB protein